jgi:AAT family amino acid transporter
VLVVLNWAHWPWTDLGLKQPLVGLCEVAFVFVPTLLLYVVLGVPSVAASTAGTSVFSINTLLGWYYSIIVAIVVTGLALDNWPWRLAGSRARVAALSLVGNVVLGTALYAVLLGVCKLLIGAATVDLLGDAIHQFPAQLGVCWVAWMIMWGNAFGNRPAGLGEIANFAARLAITFVLAVGTFALYYYVLAGSVLHEPAVAGLLHGNALGFMDWFALVTLLYVVGFESFGLPRPRTESVANEPETLISH